MDLFYPPAARTERVDLSPVTPEDGPALQGLFVDDPAVTQYVAWKPVVDDASARRFVEMEATAWREQDRCRSWLARTREDGTVIGWVIAKRHIDNAEFSYVVGRPFWGHGYATELARFVVDRARTDSEIARLWAVCDVENVASRRVLEKAGLCFEKVIPGHQRHNISEAARDCARYVLAFG